MASDSGAGGRRGEKLEVVAPASSRPSAPPWPPGYVDVALIPAGARDIRIEELAESTSFLALRSEDPGKYFLNGHWTIQWNGDYEVAGTTFTYARTGELEQLTSPGPTEEPVWVQVCDPKARVGERRWSPRDPGAREGLGQSQSLAPAHSYAGASTSVSPLLKWPWVLGVAGWAPLGWLSCAHGPPPSPPTSQLLIQESNPGVRYEYTIHQAAEPPGLGLSPRFSWTYGPWTKCTVTCGTGKEVAFVSGAGTPASASSSLLIGGATVSLAPGSLGFARQQRQPQPVELWPHARHSCDLLSSSHRASGRVSLSLPFTGGDSEGQRGCCPRPPS